MVEKWHEVKLKECVEGSLNYGLNAPAIPYKYGTPKYIRITDISEDGKYIDDEIVSADSNDFTGFYVTKGDILLARTGASTGKSYLYDENDGELVYAGFLIRAKINEERYNSAFIFNMLHTNDYWNWVIATSMRSGQPGINGKEYGSYSFLCPEKKEQDLIAEVLIETDEYIVKLEHMLKKKKNILWGTLQQLITGKIRMHGYSCEWRKGKWNDVLCGFSTGATPYRGVEDNFKGSINWVSSGELCYNWIKNTIEHISEEAYCNTSLKMHPPETFLMAITGLEAAGTRGSCARLATYATTNQSCLAIYGTEKMDINFLYYYYLLNGENLAFQYCQGTKQQSFTADIVKNLPIYYPVDVNEQRAIVTVLEDMNSEIEVLQAKISKFKDIKKGMAQALLSADIRLK